MNYPTATSHLEGPGARRVLRTVLAGALTGIAAILIAAQCASAQTPPPVDKTPLTEPVNPNPGQETAINVCTDCLKAPAADLQATTAPMTPQLAIAAEDAHILQLAAQLKMEVDQCRADTLQVDVVRKANLIQRLANELKKEVKRTSQAK